MIELKRNAVTFLGLLLAVVVFFVTGCSSQNESDMAEDHNEAEAATATDTAAVQDQDNRPGTVQKKDVLIQAHLNRADRLIEDGKLAEAKEQVMAALRYDEKNAGAQAKFKSLQDMMGESTDPQDMAQEYIKFKQAMREKQVAEVNERFLNAQRFYDRGDLDEAAEELHLADITMRYDAYQTDFGTLRPDVSTLTAEVKRRSERESAAREASEYQRAYDKLRAEDDRERRRQDEAVKTLMTQAVSAFARQDFDTSEDLARRTLDLRPGLRKARELVEYSQRSKAATWRRSFYEKRRDAMQKWIAGVREAQIPYQDLLTFPKREFWDEITLRRRARDVAESSAEDTAGVQALKNQLDNTDVTWDFTDMTITEAVQHIRDTQNVNIMLSKGALEEKGEEPADLKFSQLQFRSALKSLLDSQELTYTFQYDSVYVVKKDEATGQVVPKIYEVRDLTIQLPNFKPPTLALRPGPAGEAAQAAVFGEELEATQQTEPESLVDLVRENIEPQSWEIEDRVIEISANRLVAVTTPGIHKKIDRFLEDLRRFMKVIVHVETRFISLRQGFLQDIGSEWRGLGGTNPGTLSLLDDVTNGPADNAGLGLDNNGPGSPAADALSPSSGFFFNDPSTRTELRGRTENVFTRALGGFLTPTGGLSTGITFLDDIELSWLFRAVEKSLYASTLTAPRLTIYNNQRANLTLVNQVTYVKDYDVEVAQTAFIADPLVDIIQDGLVLDVRPTVSHDRKYVTLEVRPTVAELQRPISTFVTSLAGLTSPVIIELPELVYREAATTVKVPDNGWVLLGGLKDVSTVDRRAETPILSQIPLLSFFFSRKGRSDEISDLLIAIHVKIIDLAEEEAKFVR